MKPVYDSIEAQYEAERDQAADEWVLTHRAEFDAMAKEAFPANMPKRKGEVMRRHAVLTGMVYVKCGYPTFSAWSHPQEAAAAA